MDMFCLSLMGPSLSQQGHPAAGTWSESVVSHTQPSSHVDMLILDSAVGNVLMLTLEFSSHLMRCI